MSEQRAEMLARLAATPRQIRVRPGVKVQEHGQLFFLLLPHTWIGIAAAGFLVAMVVFTLAAGTVTGQVTGRKMEPGKKSPHWIVMYAYRDGEQSYTGSDQVSPADYERLTPGTPVSVKAMHVRGIGYGKLAVPTSNGPPWWFLLLWITVWDGILASIFWASYVLPKRQRWLLSNGQLARGVVGTVTDLPRPSRQSKQTAGQQRITYAFVTQEGEACDGRMTVPAPRLGTPLMAGDSLTVFYNPLKPKHNLAMELANYEIVSAGDPPRWSN